MYNKPNTEILDLNGDCLMQSGITLSGAGGNGPGGNEAPRRRGDIID